MDSTNKRGSNVLTSSFSLSSTEEVIEDQNRIDQEFEEEASKKRPCEKPFVSGLGLADGVSAGTISELLPSPLSFFSIAVGTSLSSTCQSSIVYSQTLSCFDIIGNGYNLAHCRRNSIVKRQFFWSVLSSLQPYLLGSCSICISTQVKTKEERSDGWPPDITA